jgi:hypothetical protein
VSARTQIRNRDAEVCAWDTESGRRCVTIRTELVIPSRELVLHHTLSAEHEHEHEHDDRLNDEGVKHFD